MGQISRRHPYLSLPLTTSLFFPLQRYELRWHLQWGPPWRPPPRLTPVPREFPPPRASRSPCPPHGRGAWPWRPWRRSRPSPPSASSLDRETFSRDIFARHLFAFEFVRTPSDGIPAPKPLCCCCFWWFLARHSHHSFGPVRMLSSKQTPRLPNPPSKISVRIPESLGSCRCAVV